VNENGDITAAEAVQDIGDVGGEDAAVLRRDLACGARDQRHLAVGADRIGDLDAAEIHGHHQRQQKRELDDRGAAAISEEAARPRAGEMGPHRQFPVE
jgi:hypothetical protein